MARPKKNNADYFSHDADMRNDPKIKALRRKFGLEGYAIWTMFLEALTDADYFEIEWTPLNIELTAGDFDCEPKLLEDIMDYCTNTLELFISQDNKIYSEKMKERFESLLIKRIRDVKPNKTELPTPKTNKEIVIADDNPQSKVKESKVKETKVNNIKEKDSMSETKVSDECDSEVITDLEVKTQNQEKEKVALKRKDFTDLEMQQVLDFFNSHCEDLPNAQKLTKKRKTAIKNILKENSTKDLGKVIRMAAESDFLNGRGISDWRANFDWILNPTNFTKISEGNYINKAKQEKETYLAGRQTRDGHIKNTHTILETMLENTEK